MLTDRKRKKLKTDSKTDIQIYQLAKTIYGVGPIYIIINKLHIKSHLL